MPAPMALEKPKSHLHGLIVRDSHHIHDLLLEQEVEFDLSVDPEEQQPRLPSRDAARRLRTWEEHGFLTPGARSSADTLW